MQTDARTTHPDIPISLSLRHLVARSGLGVTELSRRSELLRCSRDRYFIPHNLLHLIEAQGYRPTVYQLVALSAITGVPLSDCLRETGIDLRCIWTLQAALHADRTVLIPEAIETPPARLSTSGVSAGFGASRFRYARVGLKDTGSTPLLTAGSLIRIDTACPESIASASTTPHVGSLYLVDYGFGLTCRHVIRLDDSRVLLVSAHAGVAPVERRLTGIIVVGRIDQEVRPIAQVVQALQLPTCACRDSRPSAAAAWDESRAGTLRTARQRLGLALRDVHRLTLAVARESGSNRYAVAIGSLSDYEASHTLPRQVEKIVSVACAYNLGFYELLAATGVRVDLAPLSGDAAIRDIAEPPDARDFVERLPEYLAPYIPFSEFSPSQTYSVDPSLVRMHPALSGAVAVVVSRRTAAINARSPTSQSDRPIHLIEHRSGRRFCGWCIQNSRAVTVVPHPTIQAEAHCFSLNDVEALGTVIGVIRRL